MLGFCLHGTGALYPKVNIPEVTILVTGQCLAVKLLLPVVSFPGLSALLKLRQFHFPRTTGQPLLFETAAEDGRMQ